jgi:hypothetical protein
MAKNATTYTVQSINDETGEATLLVTKSKKGNAVAEATAARKAAKNRLHVQVLTGNGKVVHDAPAQKHIKMTPRFQRVVPLPDGVTAPDGFRVAYVRPRRNGAILHDGETYRIMALDTGELLEDEFEVTRDAGRRLNSGVPKSETASA